MNVIAADDATKTLTVMFGGAWSGLYQIDIRHNVYGLVNTTGLILTVGSNVTSISPNAGSIHGGTDVMITGTNFGTVFTDNPVQISSLGGVGSINCFLTSINSTNIKCRVGETSKTANSTGKMVTFLKTSEEATCVPSDACDWTYTSSIPEVIYMGASYNTTHNYW
jgi:UDP-N-acetylenolpyruvoylglucosamine reductase